MSAWRLLLLPIFAVGLAVPLGCAPCLKQLDGCAAWVDGCPARAIAATLGETQRPGAALVQSQPAKRLRTSTAEILDPARPPQRTAVRLASDEAPPASDPPAVHEPSSANSTAAALPCPADHDCTTCTACCRGESCPILQSARARLHRPWIERPQPGPPPARYRPPMPPRFLALPTAPVVTDVPCDAPQDGLGCGVERGYSGNRAITFPGRD